MSVTKVMKEKNNLTSIHINARYWLIYRKKKKKKKKKKNEKGTWARGGGGERGFWGGF
jgi:hypothetical protein